MKNRFIFIGSCSGFLATCLGAFGSHALKANISPDMLQVYQTGVNYQFYHSLALLFVGLLMLHHHNIYLKLTGYMFTIGIFLFSGSLYLLTLTGVKNLGIITPFGGIAFLLGWSMLALGINKKSIN